MLLFITIFFIGFSITQAGTQDWIAYGVTFGFGATADEKFRAFGIEGGEELWTVKMPTAAMATPMTYEAEGRQFVVIAAGGHHAYYRQKLGDHLLAFALPRE